MSPIKKNKNITVSFRFLLDFTLLVCSFFILYFTKRNKLAIDTHFYDFLPVYFAIWFFATLLSRKFKPVADDTLLGLIRPYVRALLLQIGLLSVVLYAFKWFALSRFIIFGSVGLFFVLELLALSFSYAWPYLFNKKEKGDANFSFYFFLTEFALITGTFLMIYYYKRGTVSLSDEYRAIFVIFYFVWIFIGLFVHKFQIPPAKNYLKTLWLFIKATLIQISVLSFFVFTFRVLEYSRVILFGSVLLFALFEYLVVTVLYLYKKPQEGDETQLDLFTAHLITEPLAPPVIPESERVLSEKYKIDTLQVEAVGLRKKLKNVYLRTMPEIFTFLEETIDLHSVDLMTAEILKSSDSYNVEVFPENSLDFFLNLHTVNDFRRMNNYFITVHQKLRDNGLFIGHFETFTKRRQRIFKKYPFYLASVVYFFDFIWKRVFPKLPFFQKIYFAASKGKDRVFSKAEALGRLYFCGFKVIALEEIDDSIYFVVAKDHRPATEQNPSYGPLFKMKRSGKEGKPIYVYKFRTMHPYSEYLQEYITSRNGYAVNGKIKDDFRATAWGKFLRRYWLDELPQLINVAKGEMKLIGARPLSNRVFREYPEDIKKMRVKYKPGCFPPYVALLMQNMEASIEAERIYLKEKEKHPILTDWKYLYLALYNILTNKIRSA